ncbi:STAS domain-containing protein [Sphingomonas gellani]|uniref:STAS domain-containing protein n=1 Tax=Sphingomonas gellani TaxID=1166340 RepID=A0A1H7ZEE5_9SPHN|nr:STAS domain-containing protein [Sphingomonas gellani]SEM56621.1 STAS domain-containing protein [Sphingomonas gellani]
MSCHLLTAPDHLAVRSITTFADSVRQAFDTATSITLDLSTCVEMDLSTLQVLAVARRHAVETGKTFVLSEPASGELLRLLERAGFLSAPTPVDIDFWFHGVRPQ